VAREGAGRPRGSAARIGPHTRVAAPRERAYTIELGGEMGSTGVGKRRVRVGVRSRPLTQAGCNLTADNFEYSLAA